MDEAKGGIARMTAAELITHLQKVPADCTVMSNSGWECDPTDIGGIWYNKRENEVHLTQGGKVQNEFGYKPIFGGRSEDFEKIYCTEEG